MKKWIMRLALLSLGLMLAAVLAGCHGSREMSAFEVPESFDDKTARELTFWAKNDTNKAQTDIYKSAIENFQALYPNITVTLRLYTDYGRIYNDVITNMATGTTPNVCITYPDHIATYKTGGNVVVPLDALMADEKFGLGGSEVRFDSPRQDEIVSQFLSECVLDGAYYALPFMRSTEALYVNRDYVEKLGYTLPETVTWDFIWEVSEAATAKAADGTYLVNGQNVMIPFIYKSTDNMMIQYLRQKGAGYSTETGEILLFNDDTRAFLQDLAEHVKKGAFSTFKISSYPANFLNAGQCIFAVDSTAGATWMGTNAPLLDISEDKLVPFETAVLPIPQCDPEHMAMISQGPSMCVFNKDDPQEVLASWLFTQYLLTNDVQIAYSQTEGYVPVTEKAQKTDVYQDYLFRAGEDNKAHYYVKIEATQLLLDHVKDTFVTPVFNGSASLRDAAGQLIESVTKAIRRKQDTGGSYMDDLFANVASLYHLDQGSTLNRGRRDLGPLPTTAVALLAGLAGAWALIGLYALCRAVKRKRAARKARTSG